ncbi:hypothetical protein [Curvibacter phage PCA1]|nr:hypothetical protein [Curvibacter phage PCA1]
MQLKNKFLQSIALLQNDAKFQLCALHINLAKELAMKKLLGMFTSPFTLPTAEQLARKELAEAERELLVAQSTQEYANRMAEYHSDRIRRLRGELDALDKQRSAVAARGAVAA